MTTEARPALVRRARKMNRVLAETYPDARAELDFTSPLELLVATILSAQSTDKRVNLVTPGLFAKYPDAAALAAADVTDLEAIVKPTGSSGSRRRRCRNSVPLWSQTSPGSSPGR